MTYKVGCYCVCVGGGWERPSSDAVNGDGRGPFGEERERFPSSPIQAGF